MAVIDAKTLAASKKYTDETVIGGGAIKGKNCVIDSIVYSGGVNRVTFKWTLDDGTVLTGYMDVSDGAQGPKGDPGNPGLGISSVDINAEGHLIITYEDGTTHDAGEIPGGGSVSTIAWKPTVAADGTISWERTSSEVAPETQNIMGTGIVSIDFKEVDLNGNNVYTVTLSDSSTYDITCPKGPIGEGIPTGGTTGQILAKKSNSDNDTEWVDPAEEFDASQMASLISIL